jgi:hypothetical protein
VARPSQPDQRLPLTHRYWMAVYNDGCTGRDTLRRIIDSGRRIYAVICLTRRKRQGPGLLTSVALRCCAPPFSDKRTQTPCPFERYTLATAILWAWWGWRLGINYIHLTCQRDGSDDAGIDPRRRPIVRIQVMPKLNNDNTKSCRGAVSRAAQVSQTVTSLGRLCGPCIKRPGRHTAAMFEDGDRVARRLGEGLLPPAMN